MMRTVPVVAGRWPMRSSSVLVLAALPVVWSAVLPSQSRIDVSAGGSTSQTTATAFVESDGVEAGATGRFMRSEQTAQASGRGGDTEMLQPAAFEQDTLEETSIQLQTPKPSDECAWANWFEWGACTKTCGSGRRTRSRLGTGLYAEYFFFGQGNTLPDLNGKTPNVKRIDLWVAYQDTLAAWVGLSQKENFAARWTGSLSIITGGSYFFELQSHDGARLKLNGEIVVEHNGVGRPTDMDPMIVKKASKVLAAGTSYQVELTYFEKTGRSGIVWKYKGPDTGNQLVVVPPSQLRHPAALQNCIPKKTELSVCNEQQCAIDCTWNLWSEWAGCSSTCVGGKSGRSRAIKLYKNFGGAECYGEYNQTKACNDGVSCPCVTGDCQPVSR